MMKKILSKILGHNKLDRLNEQQISIQQQLEQKFERQLLNQQQLEQKFEQQLLNQQQLEQKLERQLLNQQQLEIQMKFQSEIAFVNTAAFDNYKNINTGKDVVILASGNTLNQYLPIKSAIHIGLNSSYKFPLAKLDYYFAQDFSIKEADWINDLDKVVCKKFIGIDYVNKNLSASESFCKKVNAVRYFHSFNQNEIYLDLRFHPLMDFYSVVFPALHFALFINPKRIYLVGCDVTLSGYHTGKKQNIATSNMFDFISNILIGYRHVKEFAQRWYPDTEIISINPVHLENLFRDMTQTKSGKLIDLHHKKEKNKLLDFSDNEIISFAKKYVKEVLGQRDI